MTDYTGSNTPVERRDLWRTPPALFAALDAEFCFQLDAAAAPELLEALQELSRQYGRLWDTVNPAGGGFLSPESVVEYDRIHQLATATIAKALGKE